MKQIVLTIQDDNLFEDALAEITSNLDYDRIKYTYEVRPYPTDIAQEEIQIRIGKDDSQEVIVNKDLQIHINTNGGEGYNIDLYAYNEDTPYEERDFDKEFVTSCYASFEELNEARKPEVE